MQRNFYTPKLPNHGAAKLQCFYSIDPLIKSSIDRLIDVTGLGSSAVHHQLPDDIFPWSTRLLVAL